MLLWLRVGAFIDQLKKHDILADIAKDVAKFLAGVATERLYRLSVDRWKTRDARKFWEPFLKEDLKIVLGPFKRFQRWEPSGFLGRGDAVALAELQRFLGGLGLKSPDVLYADHIEAEALNHPLIVLGGPDANEITRLISERINTTLQFGNPKDNEIAFHDASQSPPKLFMPKLAADSQLATDFGSFFKVSNPWQPNEGALIIAGSFGYGTWAALRYLISAEFLKGPNAALASMEGLVEAQIEFDAPHHISALLIRELPGNEASPN